MREISREGHNLERGELEQMLSWAKIAKIVNPENKPLDVLNAGAGGALAISLMPTNSDHFLHVDITSWKEGYAGGPHIERMSAEARALGIKDLEVDDQGRAVYVHFYFRHPNDNAPRPEREVTYVTEDYLKFWNKPNDYQNGYDVLILTGEAPDFDEEAIQIKQLGEKMRVGGFFLSDRKLSGVVPEHALGFERIELPSGLEFHNGEAFVYKKVRQIELPIMSQLFKLNDLFWKGVDIRSKASFNLHYVEYAGGSKGKVLKPLKDHLRLLARDYASVAPKIDSEDQKQLLAHMLKYYSGHVRPIAEAFDHEFSRFYDK